MLKIDDDWYYFVEFEVDLINCWIKSNTPLKQYVVSVINNWSVGYLDRDIIKQIQVNCDEYLQIDLILFDQNFIKLGQHNLKILNINWVNESADQFCDQLDQLDKWLFQTYFDNIKELSNYDTWITTTPTSKKYWHDLYDLNWSQELIIPAVIDAILIKKYIRVALDITWLYTENYWYNDVLVVLEIDWWYVMIKVRISECLFKVDLSKCILFVYIPTSSISVDLCINVHKKINPIGMIVNDNITEWYESAYGGYYRINKSKLIGELNWWCCSVRWLQED